MTGREIGPAAATPEPDRAMDIAIEVSKALLRRNDHQPDIMAARAVIAKALQATETRMQELGRLLNTPETEDFARGVVLEAAHQRERWGVDHDAGKTPFDWFWLIGYLAQKAADAAVRGDANKAKHHTISTAAALANWHLALLGADNRMRPGIEPPAEGVSR